MFSYLDLVNQTDSFPNASTSPTIYAERLSELTLFTHGTRTLGYITPSVIKTLRNISLSGAWWTITATTVSIQGDSIEARSANIRKTADSWRSSKVFKVLDGWRDELYSVYSADGELYLRVERSAAALFGVVTYGVHMTAYTLTPSIRIWVPRRNVKKSTYGGMLDNTVAGGIASGMSVFETLVKEAAEEASFPEELIRDKARPTGTVTYFYERDERAGGETGLLQPEVQYAYDLEVDEDVVPKPCDDEVQEFYLWGVEKVKEELSKGNFKPNCALLIIDFFIRHGVLIPENEPDYIDISSRIHRVLEFPLARATAHAV